MRRLAEFFGFTPQSSREPLGGQRGDADHQNPTQRVDVIGGPQSFGLGAEGFVVQKVVGKLLFYENEVIISHFFGDATFG